AWAVLGLSEFAQNDYENARIHLQRGINLGLKGSAESLQLASLRLALLLIRALPNTLNLHQRTLAESAGAIVELLFASRYSEAFPAFQKLITANPTTPWLHYAYGNALDSLSRYDDAKTQMLAETKLSPHSALPWISLAAISLRQHLPADALRQAQTAVALAPQSEAHYQLGRAWLESGNAK